MSLSLIWATIPLLVLSLILSACLLAVEEAYEAYSWLVWIGLLPLFISIRMLAPRGAALCGALWGVSLYVFMVYGAEVRALATVRSFVLLSTAPAIYAYLGARLTRRIGFAPLFLAIGWVGVEWALSPLGLRNGLLAHSQSNGWLVHLVANVLGYGLVAFVVAYVNASLLAVFSDAACRVGRARLVIRYHGPITWVWQFVSQIRPSFRIHSTQPRAPPIGSRKAVGYAPRNI